MVIYGILLEYYNGGTLQQIFNNQQLKQHSWKNWPIPIENALNIIHQAKKTHVDIKSSNIMLDNEGNAIVIDMSNEIDVRYITKR